MRFRNTSNRDIPSHAVTYGVPFPAGALTQAKGLAVALAHRPPLLLLDEPTAGLDPAQALGVAEVMRARASDGGVLFSTHDVALAVRVAQRVVLLREQEAAVLIA